MLTLYSRPDCHLCDQMIMELRPILGEQVALQIVDISDDDDLEVRFGLRIPVLCAGETEICCYRLDRDAVTAWIESGATVT